ncbi:tRNA (guanine(37)-N1)-methyltransferase [Leptopilina heterotoma]|uniref:tRNA (guanine(37)-N1)-methyltransferase n=1 Tax=Leptopilina heterotoma TaxID=63436 RepID=UPI001CA9F4D6|nr:tRNA (guanine(37)-N1)-methyltransferase [Leptopilina heterotoma]
MASLLVPPASVRGMKNLDRDAFKTSFKVPSLQFQEGNISKIIPIVKKYFLKLRQFKSIATCDKLTTIYLDPKKIDNFQDFTDEDREIIESQNGKFSLTDLQVTYDNLRLEETLKAIFPEDIEAPGSFSQIGHIVHLNLRDCQLPYKTLIGQVILDKVPNSKTVVNKLNIIDTTFRHFSMEILAGEENTIVEVKENGCRYQFDFAKVYWNPRLGTEHERIVEFLKPQDVLYDVFAGVGPFSVPAARKGIKVLANDLNPNSHNYLVINSKINKTKDNLSAFNKDGRDFLRNEVKNDILKRRETGEPGTEHIVMNLPAIAVEFLDVFQDLFTDEEIIDVSTKKTKIHVYCFVKPEKNEKATDIAKLLVEENIKTELCSETLIEIHNVRNVAPNKEMMRVSFFLTQKILKGGEPAMKKAKLNADS